MSAGQQLGCCCCVSVVIFLIILLSASIKSIEINTYGLDYNPIWREIDDKIYISGIHWLGFAHSFITYPQQLQTLNFGQTGDGVGQDWGPIEARTIDGLTVSFKASFQYQLDEGGLYNLYMKYGEDYKTPCIRLAVDLMSDQAALFNASTFFKNPASVGTSMQASLATLFQNECASRIQSVQLSQTVLPSQYEEALEATNIVIQDSITQEQTQQNVLVDMQTNINQASIEAPIVVNEAEATKESNLARNQARVDAVVVVTQQQTESYQEILSGQFGDNQEHFLEFFKAQTIAQYNPKNILLGVNTLP